jgi:hypothetical protein
MAKKSKPRLTLRLSESINHRIRIAAAIEQKDISDIAEKLFTGYLNKFHKETLAKEVVAND